MGTVKVTARQLILEQNPKHYVEKEPSYEFSKRKFTKTQKTNIRTSS